MSACSTSNVFYNFVTIATNEEENLHLSSVMGDFFELPLPLLQRQQTGDGESERESMRTGLYKVLQIIMMILSYLMSTDVLT